MTIIPLYKPDVPAAAGPGALLPVQTQDRLPETHQVVTGLGNTIYCQIGKYGYCYRSTCCFRVRLLQARMGAEGSSFLAGVTIDSSPILTTQDWSLHHAQVKDLLGIMIRNKAGQCSAVLCSVLFKTSGQCNTVEFSTIAQNQ